MVRNFLASTLILLLAACSGGEQDYPIDPDDARRLKHGRLTGEDGLVLFGGKSDNDWRSGGAAGSGLAVNSFLWRATLDTLAFAPLQTTDPIGGVIVTEWYENPEAPGERFKVNALILDQRLRTDGISVTTFKQVMKDGTWRDAAVDKSLARKLEDTILTRAREMRIAQSR